MASILPARNGASADPGAVQQRVDFFVSYTQADVAWAEWAATVLEEAGFTTILQAWDFRPGSNFVLEMHNALRRSDRVLALLSEAYLRSVFTAPEWAAALADDPGGERVRLLPVRVGNCRPEGLLRAVVYVDLVGLEEHEASRRLLAGVAGGRAKPTQTPFPGTRRGAPSTFPGQLPAIWNVPGRNPNFAGREHELGQLRAGLAATGVPVTVLAVSGLGGVGKTQLAVEYAWRWAADYDLVWWVPAEVSAAIPGALISLAHRLDLPIDDSGAIVDLVHAELGRRERWLVVFDNAEDPGALAPYLPPGGGGHVLVTSRNPAWRARGATLDVDVWTMAEAVPFLLARSGADDEEAGRAVAEELDLLPLALEQAGAYVEETGMTLTTYRDLLVSGRGELLTRGTPAFYRATVAATFSLAYDRASELSAASAEVLGICAFLAPDDIPSDLVAAGDGVADEEALATLRRLALVRRQGDSIAVHRLISAVVRERLAPEEAATRVRAAVATLHRAFPSSPQEHHSWQRSARLLPHVLAVALHSDETQELAQLLARAGVYLWARAQLRPAYQLLERALAIREAVHGPDHLQVAYALTNLGKVLGDLGELVAARERLERALRIKEAARGRDDLEVAVTLSILGIILRDLGDPATARDYLDRALHIEEAAYGPDDPEVATTLTGLGSVLWDLGDLAEARGCLERALRINEAIHGPDHPDVATTLTSLGSVLGDLGDLEQARECLARALVIDEAVHARTIPT